MKRRHVGWACVVVAGVVVGTAPATGQTPATSTTPTSPPGKTNGPLAFQDGSGRVRLTAVGADERTAADLQLGAIASPIEDAAGPVFSPSGLRLAFTRKVHNRRQIFVTDADTPGGQKLTNDPAEAFDPTFSPTGNAIAFTSTRDGQPEIYRTDLGKGNDKRVTFSGGVQPDWSSSGEIVFSSGPAGSRDLWIVNADGSGAQPVTVRAGSEIDPEWSPDGTRIAFAEVMGARSHIFVARPDGSGARRLTSGHASDRFPTWAPTGGAIAFTRVSGSHRSTRVVSAVGKRRATRLEIGGAVRADWGALAVPHDDPERHPELLDGATAVTPTPGKGSNDISVSLPDSAQSARLARDGARVPDGSVVRVPDGSSATLVAAVPGGNSGSSSAAVTAVVSGTFGILSPDTATADPAKFGLPPAATSGDAALTLELRGAPPDCAAPGAPIASAAVSHKRKSGNRKRLEMHDNGPVRAIGGHASGLTKGTKWNIEDTCEGTLTTVESGQVEVTNLGLGTTILVTGPGSYLARANG